MAIEWLQNPTDLTKPTSNTVISSGVPSVLAEPSSQYGLELIRTARANPQYVNGDFYEIGLTVFAIDEDWGPPCRDALCFCPVW